MSVSAAPSPPAPAAASSPVSAPAAPAPAPAAAPASPTKRKSSRRANTAERRATHNAVERQRRETLNGRFLDLAALLPNLSQIRRPSKSSIVNSSIAHIHASRRHRILASRELRLLKLEADALRRELNDWRERAGIPPIDEPVRGDAFSMILSAELEVIVGVGANDADDDDDEPLSAGPPGANPAYGGYVGGDGSLPDDDYDSMDPSAGALDDPRVLAMLKQHQNPFVHSLSPNPPSGLPHLLPRPVAGSGPTNVPAFESLYDHYPQSLPHHHHVQMMQQQQHAAFLQQQQQQSQQQQQMHAMREQHVSNEREREMHIRERMQHEKTWGLYGGSGGGSGGGGGGGGAGGSHHRQQQWQSGQQQLMVQAQRSLFTPPSTSHGLPTPSPTGTHASAGGSGNNVGSPASAAGSGDEGAGGMRARSESESAGRSSRGSSSPSYELGVGIGGHPMGGGEYIGMGMGEYHNAHHGHGQVPRMGGLMVDMGMLGVGVGVGVEMR